MRASSPPRPPSTRFSRLSDEELKDFAEQLAVFLIERQLHEVTLPTYHTNLLVLVQAEQRLRGQFDEQTHR